MKKLIEKINKALAERIKDAKECGMDSALYRYESKNYAINVWKEPHDIDSVEISSASGHEYENIENYIRERLIEWGEVECESETDSRLWYEKIDSDFQNFRMAI